MKVERKEITYRFKTDDDKLIFSLDYEGYPGCCLMGIIHNFLVYNHIEFEKYKEEIGNYILKIMPSYDHTQLMVADIKDNGGYMLVKDMKQATPLNVAFNPNSKNFVYLFIIYKES